MELTKEQKILNLLLRDFMTEYNSRSISSKVSLSHVGAFKILKKLEQKEIVKSKLVGRARIYSLNLENPLTLMELETILTIEALQNKRWIEEFKQLEGKVKFVILFGSTLRNEQSARDIDLLVVADNANYKFIRKIIDERNRISNKPIQLVFQTPDNFKFDLKRKYKVSIEIIKTGVVLIGQGEFRRVLTENGPR